MKLRKRLKFAAGSPACLYYAPPSAGRNRPLSRPFPRSRRTRLAGLLAHLLAFISTAWALTYGLPRTS